MSEPRLFYVDDSGVENTGWVIFGWAEFMLSDWRDVLAHRLQWRKDLFHSEAQIPASYHLHTAEFLGNRGPAPSLNAEWNAGTKKYIRRKRVDVLTQALANVGTAAQLQVGLAYRQTTARGKVFALEKVEVYEKLVNHLDQRLGSVGETGLLVLDGDGSDISFSQGHRTLPLRTRRLLEDPLYQRSHSSQLIQMADLIAFAGYQSLLQNPEKQFAWSWYSSYLAAKDVNSGPLAL